LSNLLLDKPFNYVLGGTGFTLGAQSAQIMLLKHCTISGAISPFQAAHTTKAPSSVSGPATKHDLEGRTNGLSV
jgi:hypothetical protein